MRNRFLKFVIWLNKKKDVEFRFHVAVLEEENSKVDSSLPKPPLSHLDSRSLFSYLASKELAEKIEEDVFELNRVEQWKWNETIRELKKAEWRRHPIWIRFCSVILFLVVAIIGGIIGSYSKEIGSALFKKDLRPFANYCSDKSTEKGEEKDHPKRETELTEPTENISNNIPKETKD